MENALSWALSAANFSLRYEFARDTVVTLSANRADRADVLVGEPVSFVATVEVPSGMGKVVAAEWDFLGEGTYPIAAEIPEPAASVSLSASHAYDRAGTWFVALRVASQRDGDTATLYARVHKLGRVRVVVR